MKKFILMSLVCSTNLFSYCPICADVEIFLRNELHQSYQDAYMSYPFYQDYHKGRMDNLNKILLFYMDNTRQMD